MKAYVYHGPDQKGAWEEVPNPTILEPTDVIARVDTTTICGTDLRACPMRTSSSSPTHCPPASRSVF